VCGRVALFEPPSRLARFLDAGLEISDQDLEPSWNIGPMGELAAVRETSRGERELALYRWGLVPSWAKDPNIKGTFNARAETVATKPTFRAAFARWRVLVPVDAFYEWKRTDRWRQPYAFKRADGEPVVFAGLREWWKGPDGNELRTATIITTEAGPDMPIHDREPVVLERRDWDLWLDPAVTDPWPLQPLLVSTAAGTLVHYPVDRALGDVRNDRPELLDEVDLNEPGDAGQVPLFPPTGQEPTLRSKS
jgi:putative SOS response-associated peptidase YedK